MQSESKRQVVVAGVIERDGKVLVAQRSSGANAGKWEFPGGKVRDGESPEEALVREIEEEFGASISVGALVGKVPFEIGERHYILAAYRARHRSGEWEPREHAAVEWMAPNTLGAVDLAPADAAIARRLNSLS